MHPRYRWLSDWLYYFLVLPVTSRLPLRWGVRLARRRGRHFADVDPRRREQVEAGLRSALPEVDAGETARLLFENEAVEELDTFYYPSLSAETVAERFDFEGLEHLDRALAAGRGALMVTAHIGSFCSVVPALAARGYPLNYLAHNSPDDPTFSPAFRRYAGFKIRQMERTSERPVVLFTLRGSDGSGREAGLAAFSVLDRLRDNELVSIAIDVPHRLVQNTAEAQFLGRLCRFPVGFLKVVRLTGSPVVPYVTLRAGPDWIRHRVILHPPVHLSGDPAADLGACLRPLEAAIRRHPEQWLSWDILEQFES